MSNQFPHAGQDNAWNDALNEGKIPSGKRLPRCRVELISAHSSFV